MKVFQKDYQRTMAEVNRYIANMTEKDGWDKTITVSKKDYDLLVKSGHAKEIYPGLSKYRHEYTITFK